jgi:hypothetical protein
MPGIYSDMTQHKSCQAKSSCSWTSLEGVGNQQLHKPKKDDYRK